MRFSYIRKCTHRYKCPPTHTHTFMFLCNATYSLTYTATSATFPLEPGGRGQMAGRTHYWFSLPPLLMSWQLPWPLKAILQNSATESRVPFRSPLVCQPPYGSHFVCGRWSQTDLHSRPRSGFEFLASCVKLSTQFIFLSLSTFFCEMVIISACYFQDCKKIKWMNKYSSSTMTEIQLSLSKCKFPFSMSLWTPHRKAQLIFTLG